MHRRSFIASVAAAMGTAAVPFKMPELVPPAIRYDLFCSTWEGRFDLKSPWAIAERLIATDGVVLISTPVDHSREVEKGRKVPSLHLLPWRDINRRGYKAPNIEKVRSASCAQCPRCFGLTRVGSDVRVKACEACDGTKFCTVCHGDGELIVGGEPCAECEMGWVKFAYKINGVTVSPGYIGKISTLGEVEFLQTDVSRLGDALAFKFGNGGFGLLMGMYR